MALKNLLLKFWKKYSGRMIQPSTCRMKLTLLEMIWLEKLQPFGERGYNLQ
ncbi:MAG: hypothetical protein U0V48_17630 [Anaerolineales bacterium]